MKQPPKPLTELLNIRLTPEQLDEIDQIALAIGERRATAARVIMRAGLTALSGSKSQAASR